MKKIYSLLLLFLPFFISAQTTNLIWDWENHPTSQPFDPNTCSLIAGGAYIATVQIPWYGTHGELLRCLCGASGEREHILVNLPNTGTPSGRGFAIQYNFKAGYRYTISIDGVIADTKRQDETRSLRHPIMQVGFTNSINIQNNLCTGNGVGVVDISTLTSPMETFTASVYGVSMDLNECKQYLWFSAQSSSAGENSGSIKIRKLTIAETPIKYTIAGPTSLCSGSTNFSMPDLPAGTSVQQWSASPADIVSLSPNGSQVTATKIGSGVVTISARVSVCGTDITYSTGVAVGTPTEAASLMEIYGGGQSEPLALCPNTSYQVEASFPTAYPQYEWMLPAGWTSTESGGSNPFLSNSFNVPVRTGSSTDPGFIRVRAKNACGFGDAAFLSVDFECMNFMVYPNPAKSKVSLVPITTDKSSSELQNIRSVAIFDLSGRLRKKIYTNGGGLKVDVDVSTLSDGIYIMEIDNGKRVAKQRLLIKR